MERRNFIKWVAAMLPATLATKMVSKQADAAPQPTPASQVYPKTVKAPSMLKARRHTQMVYDQGFCDCPAERGMVVEFAKFIPSPSGGQYPIVRPGSHSGQPLGILLQDVVHIDNTKLCNVISDRIPVGGRVDIGIDGWVIVGQFDKPVEDGERIFYDRVGRLTTVSTGRPIGVAIGPSDADNFVKVKIQLYVNTNAELPRP